MTKPAIGILRAILAALSLSAISLCRAADIKEGASRRDVIEALGRPGYAVGSGNKETLGYGARQVKLVDGVVVDAGVPEAAGPKEDEGVAEAAPNEGADGQEMPEEDSIEARRKLAADYLNQLQRDTGDTIRRLMNDTRKELRKADTYAHRLKGTSPGLPPIEPMGIITDAKVEQYQGAKRAYDATVDRLRQEAEEAAMAAGKIGREYADLEGDSALLKDCEPMVLERLAIKYGTCRPVLRTGYVGFIGRSVIEQRIGEDQALVRLRDAPGTDSAIASGFNLLHLFVDGTSGFAGVVEVVGPRTYTTVENAPRTVFEFKPYVRDVNAPEIRCQGSGFLVTRSGYIITNRHVVSDSKRELKELRVWVGTTSYAGKLVAVDEKQDLAVLRIEGKHPFLPLLAGTGSVFGQDVYVMGFPASARLGKDVKVTKGVVGSRAKKDESDGSGGVFFQLDANAYHGNSGGPVVLVKTGEVVGVLTAGGTGELESVQYGTPVSCVQDFLRRQAPDAMKEVAALGEVGPTGSPDAESMSECVVLIYAYF